MSVWEALKDGLLETLYPTTCAVCGVPGELICKACEEGLVLIDQDRACEFCGAPNGREQCTECDGAFPFSACRATGSFDEGFAAIIHAYKDGGERRLCANIARMMAVAAGADWRSWAEAVCFVPATLSAYRTRGFDHMELVAKGFADVAHIPLADVLLKRETKDQRELDARQRAENADRSIVVSGSAFRPHVGKNILVLDDVFTTGATLSAAAKALRLAGARDVRAVVFARVW